MELILDGWTWPRGQEPCFHGRLSRRSQKGAAQGDIVGQAPLDLGLSVPSFNRGGHIWETSPLAPEQPFSSVQVGKWVRRAGSAHTPSCLGSPVSHLSLGTRPGPCVG